MDLEIKPTVPADYPAIWKILQSVNAGEDVFSFPATWTYEEMFPYWFSPDKHTYTAWLEGEIVGSFYLKANQPGLGAHIANAGYATSAAHRGMGIAYTMGVYSLQEAKRLGFLAMQFNMVIKTNEVAVRLWQRLGFQIIGEIPEAFQHARFGLVNAYIMYRKL